MTGRRVFVVQPPSRIDPRTKKVIVKYDLTAAERYGRLVYVLGPGNIYGPRLEQAQQQIRTVLRDFAATDYILAIGDPVAIAMVAIVACQKTGGLIPILKYDKRTGEYTNTAINMKE